MASPITPKATSPYELRRVRAHTVDASCSPKPAVRRLSRKGSFIASAVDSIRSPFNKYKTGIIDTSAIESDSETTASSRSPERSRSPRRKRLSWFRNVASVGNLRALSTRQSFRNIRPALLKSPVLKRTSPDGGKTTDRLEIRRSFGDLLAQTTGPRSFRRHTIHLENPSKSDSTRVTGASWNHEPRLPPINLPPASFPDLEAAMDDNFRQIVADHRGLTSQKAIGSTHVSLSDNSEQASSPATKLTPYNCDPSQSKLLRSHPAPGSSLGGGDGHYDEEFHVHLFRSKGAVCKSAMLQTGLKQTKFPLQKQLTPAILNTQSLSSENSSSSDAAAILNDTAIHEKDIWPGEDIIVSESATDTINTHSPDLNSDRSPAESTSGQRTPDSYLNALIESVLETDNLGPQDTGYHSSTDAPDLESTSGEYPNTSILQALFDTATASATAAMIIDHTEGPRQSWKMVIWEDIVTMMSKQRNFLQSIVGKTEEQYRELFINRKDHHEGLIASELVNDLYHRRPIHSVVLAFHYWEGISQSLPEGPRQDYGMLLNSFKDADKIFLQQLREASLQHSVAEAVSGVIKTMKKVIRELRFFVQIFMDFESRRIGRLQSLRDDVKHPTVDVGLAVSTRANSSSCPNADQSGQPCSSSNVPHHEGVKNSFQHVMPNGNTSSTSPVPKSQTGRPGHSSSKARTTYISRGFEGLRCEYTAPANSPVGTTDRAEASYSRSSMPVLSTDGHNEAYDFYRKAVRERMKSCAEDIWLLSEPLEETIDRPSLDYANPKSTSCTPGLDSASFYKWAFESEDDSISDGDAIFNTLKKELEEPMARFVLKSWPTTVHEQIYKTRYTWTTQALLRALDNMYKAADKTFGFDQTFYPDVRIGYRSVGRKEKGLSSVNIQSYLGAQSSTNAPRSRNYIQSTPVSIPDRIWDTLNSNEHPMASGALSADEYPSGRYLDPFFGDAVKDALRSSDTDGDGNKENHSPVYSMKPTVKYPTGYERGESSKTSESSDFEELPPTIRAAITRNVWTTQRNESINRKSDTTDNSSMNEGDGYHRLYRLGLEQFSITNSLYDEGKGKGIAKEDLESECEELVSSWHKELGKYTDVEVIEGIVPPGAESDEE